MIVLGYALIAVGAVLLMLLWLFLLMVIAAVIATRSDQPVMWFTVVFMLECAAIIGTAAVVLFIRGDVAAGMFMAAATGLALWAAWDEWTRRRRRRKPSRVAGVVRDLGGRLGVVPT